MVCTNSRTDGSCSMLTSHSAVFASRMVAIVPPVAINFTNRVVDVSTLSKYSPRPAEAAA